MENVVLKRSDEVKYLGVTVYQQLTWRQHIERVRKKCLSLLYKIKGTLSLKLRKQHFESFIQPHLDYCSVVWAKCSKEAGKNTEVRDEINSKYPPKRFFLSCYEV